MKFRKLRIAFSIACGIACALLVALWLRGYWQYDNIRGECAPYLFGVDSCCGQFEFTAFDPNSSVPVEDQVTDLSSWDWKLHSNLLRVSAILPLSRNDAPRLLNSLGFGWCFAPTGFGVLLPYWFLVLISFAFGTLAAFPWLRWRFSLRTLLIVTTLVAAMLVFIIYTSRA